MDGVKPTKKSPNLQSQLLDLKSEIHGLRTEVRGRGDLDQVNREPSLYLSPRVWLPTVTLLNVALFVGGTAYTGVQVASIQERYAAASDKIRDAVEKYRGAEQQFTLAKTGGESLQTQFERVTEQTSELQGRSEKLFASFSSSTDKILTDAKSAGEAVKIALDDFFKQAESSLKTQVSSITTTLEKTSQANSDTLTALSTKIRTIQESALSIEKAAGDAQNTLTASKAKIDQAIFDHARLLGNLEQEIEHLKGAKTVGLRQIWEGLDKYAQASVGSIAGASMLSLLLSLWALRRRP